MGNINDVNANAAEKTRGTGWMNIATFPFEELVSNCRNECQRQGRLCLMVTNDEFLCRSIQINRRATIEKN